MQDKHEQYLLKRNCDFTLVHTYEAETDAFKTFRRTSNSPNFLFAQAAKAFCPTHRGRFAQPEMTQATSFM